jgi:uncharacterized membrane protein
VLAIVAVILCILIPAGIYLAMELKKRDIQLHSRMIVFSVDPQDAEILIDGKKYEPVTEKDGTRAVKDLQPGSHEVTFSKKGYFLQSVKNVEVFADRTSTLEKITLKPLPPASIVFSAEPAENEVYLDGALQKPEKTSDGRMMIASVAPGDHLFRIERRDYESYQNEKVSVSKDTSAELEPVTLKPKFWKTVEIYITPKEIDLYMNDRKIATRRTSEGELVTEPLEPAKYRVRIEAKGYKKWTADEVEVFDDISTTIGPIVLKK